jgi:hypothetical protein
MNEPEILDAYRGLSTPESPPADLLDRVNGRIGRRRTIRRAVTGLAAAAVVGGTSVVLLGGSDGTDTKDVVADDPGSSSTLTFTHVDGGTYTFAAADLGLFCTTSDSGTESLLLTRADLVDDLEAGREPGERALESAPLLYVEVLVDKVEPGQEFRLPYDSRSGDSSDRAMTFFFASQEGGMRANEVSSAEPGATGTVTVHEASCGANPTLSIDIAGTLGSEVEQQAMAIEGSYRS